MMNAREALWRLASAVLPDSTQEVWADRITHEQAMRYRRSESRQLGLSSAVTWADDIETTTTTTTTTSTTNSANRTQLNEYLFDLVVDPTGPIAPDGTKKIKRTKEETYAFTIKTFGDITLNPFRFTESAGLDYNMARGVDIASN